MAPVSLKFCVSFNSQDPRNPAENLLGLGGGKGKWLSAPGDKSGKLEGVFQFERSCKLTHIDIGVKWTFLCQIMVGRSSWPAGRAYETLVTATPFMSATDCKRGNNPEVVRMFKYGDLSEGVRDEDWDRIQIVLTQPFRKDVQYGVSMLRLISADAGVSGQTPSCTNGNVASASSHAKSTSNKGSPSAKSASEIQSIFFRNGDKRNKHAERLKSQLGKIGASTEHGTQEGTLMSRTAKLVLAAASNTPNYKRPAGIPKQTPTAIRRKPFADEVREFLPTLKLTPEEINNMEFKDLRHKMEKVKCRKLSKEERKVFFSLAQEFMDSYFLEMVSKEKQARKKAKEEAKVGNSSVKCSEASTSRIVSNAQERLQEVRAAVRSTQQPAKTGSGQQNYQQLEMPSSRATDKPGTPSGVQRASTGRADSDLVMSPLELDLSQDSGDFSQLAMDVSQNSEQCTSLRLDLTQESMGRPASCYSLNDTPNTSERKKRPAESDTSLPDIPMSGSSKSTPSNKRARQNSPGRTGESPAATRTSQTSKPSSNLCSAAQFSQGLKEAERSRTNDSRDHSYASKPGHDAYRNNQSVSTPAESDSSLPDIPMSGSSKSTPSHKRARRNSPGRTGESPAATRTSQTSKPSSNLCSAAQFSQGRKEAELSRTNDSRDHSYASKPGRGAYRNNQSVSTPSSHNEAAVTLSENLSCAAGSAASVVPTKQRTLEKNLPSSNGLSAPQLGMWVRKHTMKKSESFTPVNHSTPLRERLQNSSVGEILSDKSFSSQNNSQINSSVNDSWLSSVESSVNTQSESEKKGSKKKKKKQKNDSQKKTKKGALVSCSSCHGRLKREKYSETCLERLHVRAVALDRWSLFTGKFPESKIAMHSAGCQIELSSDEEV